jgi:hypothetical protein
MHGRRSRRAVVAIAAEGVETEQQRELLHEPGCSEMQGYLFSPPKPAAEIRPMLLADRDEPRRYARVACADASLSCGRRRGKPLNCEIAHRRALSGLLSDRPTLVALFCSRRIVMRGLDRKGTWMCTSLILGVHLERVNRRFRVR